MAETCVGPLCGAAELITLINFASTRMDPLETDAASLATSPRPGLPTATGAARAAPSARPPASPPALHGPGADGSLCRVRTAWTHLGLPHLPLAKQGGGAHGHGDWFLVTVTREELEACPRGRDSPWLAVTPFVVVGGCPLREEVGGGHPEADAHGS